MPSEKATLLRTAAETLRAIEWVTVGTTAPAPVRPDIAYVVADWLTAEAAAMDREHAALMLRQPQSPNAATLGYRAQRVDERVARAHLHALRVAGRVLGASDIPPRYPVDTVEEVGYLISADLSDEEALAVVDEHLAMEGYDPLDRDRVKQVTRGWYRKNPCPPNLCGEHAWHIGDGQEGQSGSFQGTLVEVL